MCPSNNDNNNYYNNYDDEVGVEWLRRISYSRSLLYFPIHVSYHIMSV